MHVGRLTKQCKLNKLHSTSTARAVERERIACVCAVFCFALFLMTFNLMYQYFSMIVLQY